LGSIVKQNDFTTKIKIWSLIVLLSICLVFLFQLNVPFRSISVEIFYPLTFLIIVFCCCFVVLLWKKRRVFEANLFYYFSFMGRISLFMYVLQRTISYISLTQVNVINYSRFIVFGFILLFFIIISLLITYVKVKKPQLFRNEFMGILFGK